MSKNDKDKDKGMLKDENVNNTINKGNSVPNIRPTGEPEIVDNEDIIKGKVGGAPTQKSGSRGSADVEDGGNDIGSSAGSH
ncbi:hypothetical protein [Pontibacter akesuensis]|uniref:Uncharacterized protein n=1 Tax=Pontibacter akesuensis TaxID=388950 RepID=A0A1I7FSJ1_9BACT|nr:hypothetical protein [Pontibacter akesuensis]GHA60717.1 hypothetical protein GCM10007389_11250 [Pontibacter akesuensis]SFU39189.1 hypothetical protein SAMN04487941_0436 [Pontibacter akesuensis]